MADRRDHGVPSWNGDLALWEDYVSDVHMYVAGTKYNERYLCGPRLQSRLEGPARTSTRGKPRDWLSHDEGAETLLQHLQFELAKPEISDSGSMFEEFFVKLRRRRGESMQSWITRHGEAYERTRVSLARVLKSEKQQGSRLERERQGRRP